MDSTSIINVITQTINTLFKNLFSSIDNNIYATLDDITFIGSDILNDNFSAKVLGTSATTGIIIIANALLIELTIYYATKFLFSNYTMTQIEKPYQFIFKILIITVCVNCSYFICEQVLNINYLISGSIREVGERVLNTNISFEELILRINSVILIDDSLNIFSFDGVIKSFTSISLLNLLFSYALRYVMIKVFVLLTPFAIITLLNNSTMWIFKSWIKSVITLLFVQSFVSIILLVIFSMTFSMGDTFSKLIYIGSIYALIKANSLLKQIIGGITTEVSGGISGIKSLLK